MDRPQQQPFVLMQTAVAVERKGEISMELRQLEYFVAVVEHGGFNEAAKRLYISQAGLSKAVKKLENDLGVALFCQVEQRTTPTDAGMLLYEKARFLLAEAAHARDLVLSEMKRKQGRVRIATSCKRTYFQKVGRLAARFQKMYPQITLEFTEASPAWVRNALLRGNADVGIIGEALGFSPPEFDEIILDRASYMLAVHRDNPLAGKESVSISELADENWILFPPSFHLFKMVNQSCDEVGFTPKIIFTATQPEFIYAMVDEGLGISIHPWPKCEAECGLQPWDNVVMMPISDFMDQFSAKLITAKEKYLSPAAKTFIEFVMSDQF